MRLFSQESDLDIWAGPPDATMQRFEHVRAYARAERLPWRRSDGTAVELRAAEARPCAARIPLRKTSRLPRRIFSDLLGARFERDLVDASRHALARRMPHASSMRLMTPGQRNVAAAMILAAAFCFAAAPHVTLIAANIFLTGFFLVVIFFRLRLISESFAESEKAAPPPLADAELPTITILCPLYREADSLEGLAAALSALDYPADRLDIKLIFEEDDAETLTQARRLGLDRVFECLAIPASEPRTKPKACNHALYLARGDLIVIYDAEDAPERDQLRKAAAAFAAGDDSLACVQARLNYYNAFENWLTSLFAVEYALWFDSFLPALERLKIPIPLGGTSNFFRTSTLIEIGGWDPFNVTEDADIGFRLARHGFRTEVLDSTTFEEACANIGAWLRQRSRWMKGHMQTWLVHMRRPNELRGVAGWRGVAANQLFIGGNFLSALINPFLWTVFFWQLLSGADAVAAFFPGPLLALNLFALLAGNCFFIYLGVIAPLRRGLVELAPCALLAPVYWWLSSLAAYMALWQLATRPSYWEKTAHGRSSLSRERAASFPERKAA